MTRNRNNQRGLHDATAAGTDTAAALIAAGRKLFARHGYDGSSVRAITTDAAVNLGAITYHFGSKRGLYDAVVGSCMEPFADRVTQAIAAGGDPLTRLDEVVNAYFDHLWSNPDLPFLMMQELAAGRLPPPSGTAAIKRILGSMAGLIREGQTFGVIRDGDPQLMALSVVAQPVHLTVVRRVAQSIAGIDQGDPTMRARLVEHVATFVRRGLAAERPRAAGATGRRKRKETGQ